LDDRSARRDDVVILATIDAMNPFLILRSPGSSLIHDPSQFSRWPFSQTDRTQSFVAIKGSVTTS